MKNKFIAIGLIAIFTINFGCKKNEDPAICSVKIEMGDFTPDFELPYDEFQYIEITNAAGEKKGMSVNHPSDLSFFKVKTVGSEAHSSNCQLHGSVEQYDWSIGYKQAFVSLNISGINPPAVVIRETSMLDETEAQPAAIGDYLEFYLRDAYTGLIQNAPYMRLMTKALLPGKGQDLEFGYTFYNSIEIGGKTFSSVYVNTTVQDSPAKKIYYNRQQGIIAVEDNQGVAWKIDL